MENTSDNKNPAAQKLGSLGGKARAKKYSKKQLQEWAKKGGRPKSVEAIKQ